MSAFRRRRRFGCRGAQRDERHRSLGAPAVRRDGTCRAVREFRKRRDSEIALTIAQGDKVADVQQDGGSVIFALFDSSCHEIFRVIYNGRAYNGNGVSPQGIITAYYISISLAVPRRPSIPTYRDVPASRAAAGYRTDCPVVQTV